MTVKMAASSSRLAELRADLTRQLILDTALQLLAGRSVSELTARAIAGAARISERTVFRYFSTRDELLDAVARALIGKLEAPPLPRTIAELRRHAAVLYGSFEAHAPLVRLALSPELSSRIRDTQGVERWKVIGRLIDAHAPRAPERARRQAAANIRYVLCAATWSYYRGGFRFPLEEAIACAERAIDDALRGLRAGGGGSSRGPKR